MVTIRSQQMDAFYEHRLTPVVKAIEDHLRSTWPNKVTTFDKGRFQEFVLEMTKLAKVYRLGTMTELRTFAECALLFGPPPWCTPWARPLGTRDLPLVVRNAEFVKLSTAALKATRDEPDHD